MAIYKDLKLIYARFFRGPPWIDYDLTFHLIGTLRALARFPISKLWLRLSLIVAIKSPILGVFTFENAQTNSIVPN